MNKIKIKKNTGITLVAFVILIVTILILIMMNKSLATSIYKYNANEVNYNNNSVAEALDDLYSKSKNNGYKLLKYDFIYRSSPLSYTFEDDYDSAIVSVCASNNNGAGYAYINSNLSEGTMEHIYNNVRATNGSYSQSSALAKLYNIKKGDTITFSVDYIVMYTIIVSDN